MESLNTLINNMNSFIAKTTDPNVFQGNAATNYKAQLNGFVNYLQYLNKIINKTYTYGENLKSYVNATDEEKSNLIGTITTTYRDVINTEKNEFISSTNTKGSNKIVYSYDNMQISELDGILAIIDNYIIGNMQTIKASLITTSNSQIDAYTSELKSLINNHITKIGFYKIKIRNLFIAISNGYWGVEKLDYITPANGATTPINHTRNTPYLGYTFPKNYFSNFKMYNLTLDQIKQIARLCRCEQGASVAGVMAEASLIANKYELYLLSHPDGLNKYPDLISYVRNCRWWSHADRNMGRSEFDNDELISAVNDVLNNGNRTLPNYIDEHDCLSDITSSTSNLVSGQTVIYNKYGAVYTFYCKPDTKCDPFGYTQNAYNLRQKENGQ